MIARDMIAAHQREDAHAGCDCGNWWPATGMTGDQREESYADHVLDALASAGHVVVELPEPWAPACECEPMSPAAARCLAAALLAAADRAEAGQ